MNLEFSLMGAPFSFFLLVNISKQRVGFWMTHSADMSYLFIFAAVDFKKNGLCFEATPYHPVEVY